MSHQKKNIMFVFLSIFAEIPGFVRMFDDWGFHVLASNSSIHQISNP